MGQPFEIITDPEVEARRKARAEEYGTWECGPQHIEFDGARAFNEGEPVPKSTVERLGLDRLGAVVSAGTFAEKSAEREAALRQAQDDRLREQLSAGAPAPAEDEPKPRARGRASAQITEEGGN